MRLGAGGLLGLLLLLGGCTNPQPIASATASPAAAPSPAPSTAPPIRIIGSKSGHKRVEISQISHNRIVYHLFADSSLYDSRSHQGTFQKAHGLFYEKDGKTMTVDAPTAVVDQLTKSVTMSGGVHAMTQDGAVLTCAHLVYDDVSGRVHGDGNVKLTRKNEILTGEYIDADLHLEQYKVTGS